MVQAASAPTHAPACQSCGATSWRIERVRGRICPRDGSPARLLSLPIWAHCQVCGHTRLIGEVESRALEAQP